MTHTEPLATLIDPMILANLLAAFPDSEILPDPEEVYPPIAAERVTVIERIEIAPGVHVERERVLVRSTGRPRS